MKQKARIAMIKYKKLLNVVEQQNSIKQNLKKLEK